MKKENFLRFVASEEADNLISDLSENPLERVTVLRALSFIISTSIRRISKYHTKNSERLAWARIVTRAATASTGLLRDRDIEELDNRITNIEEVLNDREE